MIIFNPLSLLPFAQVVQNLYPLSSISPLILNGINFNDGTTVIGGIIIGGIIVGIPKLFSYFKHKYDTSIKTSYDIDTLFADYAEVRKAVDDGNESNKAILQKLDKGSQKIDNMIKDSKQTRFLIQELSKMVYDHDEILYERRKYKTTRIPHIRRRQQQAYNKILEDSENDEENNDDP